MQKTLGVLMVIFAFVAGAYPQPVKGLDDLKGKTIPDFQLRDLNGKTQRFSQFKGKVVLLNFWSPYCSGCGMEVPHLNGWYRKYRKDGLIVIGLSTVSPKEQKEAAKRFGITYPLFLWERNKLPQLLRTITGYPTTLLIDRNGKIREVVFGILFGEQKDAFERKIVAALKEKPKEEKGGRQAR